MLAGKWRQLHTQGKTVFTEEEHAVALPSADVVYEQTHFGEGVFNEGLDVPPAIAPGVGGRWQGWRTGPSKADPMAPWIHWTEPSVHAWLYDIGWLATSKEGVEKMVCDMQALIAGVDVNGDPAQTSEQAPPHADCCAPNSDYEAGTDWRDVHLAALIAFEDGTHLPHSFFKIMGQGGDGTLHELDGDRMRSFGWDPRSFVRLITAVTVIS